MNLDRVIAEAVTEKTGEVAAPPVDVAALTRRGKRRVAFRRAGIGLVAVAALAASGGVLGLVDDARRGDSSVVVADGPLSYSDGLRAYMDPGSEKIHLGGATVSIRNAWNLDTDAIATPYGLLGFESNRRPYLLKEDGSLAYLGPAPKSPDGSFYPRAKSDAMRPHAAWAEYDGGKAVTIRLHNLDSGASVGSIQVPCASEKECRKVRVEAVDQGLVFVRAPKGNHVWDPAADGDGRWTYLGGSTIADVRNKVIMMTGARPSMADLPEHSPIGRTECDSDNSDCYEGDYGGWRFIQGEIDAQLSYDGRWKLYWSNKLEPTSDQDQAITLDVPSGDFVAFDTDGSVLVASHGDGSGSADDAPGGPPRALPSDPTPGAEVTVTADPDRLRELPDGTDGSTYRMYDCELPSGACVDLGEMKVTGGDPLFIGNDM